MVENALRKDMAFQSSESRHQTSTIPRQHRSWRNISEDTYSERRAIIESQLLNGNFYLLTTRQQEVLLRLYKDGMTSPGLVAENLGVSRQDVYITESRALTNLRLMSDPDFNPSRFPRKMHVGHGRIEDSLSNEQIRDICDLYTNGGKALAEIAEKYSCSITAIASLLERSHISRRNRGQPRTRSGDKVFVPTRQSHLNRT